MKVQSVECGTNYCGIICTCEISSSHGGEYDVQSCLLGCSDSSLMMEAVRTSETSVDNHFTRQYNPEDSSEQNYLYMLNIIYINIIMSTVYCIHLCNFRTPIFFHTLISQTFLERFSPIFLGLKFHILVW
jgi:hypothetical protein